MTVPLDPAHVALPRTRAEDPLPQADQDPLWVSEAGDQVAALDNAVSEAIAATPTPALDRLLVGVSNAANGSRLWLVTAGAVALVGGARGRRAAAEAVASVALASVVSNLVLKSLAHRGRPHTPAAGVAPSREIRRPSSSSFPSGHSASAFAFASTLGEELPPAWLPAHVAASLVAYSRVHTGVHYPSDVAVGALVGAACGWTVRRLAAELDAVGVHRAAAA